MKVEQKEKTTIIKQVSEDSATFATKVLHESHCFKNKNLILDISNKTIDIKQLSLFLELVKHQKKEKKSMVIVASNINFNEISNKLIVVPTLLEANDIIEMEEIERDLGF